MSEQVQLYIPVRGMIPVEKIAVTGGSSDAEGLWVRWSDYLGARRELETLHKRIRGLAVDSGAVQTDDPVEDARRGMEEKDAEIERWRAAAIQTNMLSALAAENTPETLVAGVKAHLTDANAARERAERERDEARRALSDLVAWRGGRCQTSWRGV